MSKKDLITSIVAHLALIALIAVINPISAMLRPDLGIIIVKTYDMGGGPATKQSAQEPEPEPANIAPPQPREQAPEEKVEDAVPIKPIEKEKPVVAKPKSKPKPKPKPRPDPGKINADTEAKDQPQDDAPKPDGKGGLEVNEKVGGAGSGTGIGSGTSNLPYNIGMVLSVIERNWRNVVADANPITCTIYFQIDRYGFVVGDPIIEKSSGISTFDQGCILAILKARQFPPFPASFDYQYIGLHLDFEYVPGM